MRKCTLIALLTMFAAMQTLVFAQVKFRVGLQPDKKTYNVYLRPDISWAPPLNSTVSSQLSLRVPTGGFDVAKLASKKGQWQKSVHVKAPTEAPGYDYISFSLVAPTNDITYEKGKEVLIFTFENSGKCVGNLVFIENEKDPFWPPNSKNMNVGNLITVSGAGPGVNAYRGPYSTGGYDCLTSSQDCGITYNGIDYASPTTCGARDGYIEVYASTNLGLALQYSINNGRVWSASNRFNNLIAGTYHVLVRDIAALCIEDIGVIELPGPLAAAVTSTPVVQPGCGQSNGSITINAYSIHNDPLEFSINKGATWQKNNVFTGLAEGLYNLMVRNLANGCTGTIGQIALNGCPIIPCLVFYELETLPDGRYQVSMLSDTTWGFPQNITSNMQITIKAPTGGLQIGDFRNELPDVVFAPSGTFVKPTEEPANDYFTIALQTQGTNAISYRKGLKLPLFSFANEGLCTGDSMRLINNLTDPFMPPNSQNANVGQQLSVFGYGSADLPVCLGTKRAVECKATPKRCLAEFQLEQLPDGKYQVAMVPDTTWIGTARITSALRLTVKVPTGGFTVGNLTSKISGVSFMSSGRYNSPNEAPNFDYINFDLSNSTTDKIPYEKGKKTALFTFENTGLCTAQAIGIMDPRLDPFKSPNSASAAVGISLKVTGNGSQDVPTCFTNATNTDCPDLQRSRDTVYLTIPTDVSTNKCLGAVVQVPNSIGSASVLTAGTFVKTTPTAQSDCILIEPKADFRQSDALTLVHCDSNIPGFCDTTVVVLCPQVKILPADEICAGASVNLRSLGGAGTLTWSPAAGLSCTNCPDPIATPASTTVYSLSANESARCQTSATVEVKVNLKPAPTFAFTGTCAGVPTAFRNNTPNPSGLTWLWTFGDGTTSTEASPSHAFQGNGTYRVVLAATSAKGCSTTTEQTITISPASASGASFNQAVCENESIRLSAQGGVTYSWSPATGLSATNIANPLASPTTNTSYLVTIGESSGCSRVDTFRLDVTKAPAIIDVITTLPVNCEVADGSIRIIATDGSNALSYSIDGGTNWQPTNLFAGLGKGSYRIAVRSETTFCVSKRQQTIDFSDPAAPVIQSVVTTKPASCDVADGSIRIAATGNGTIEYSVDNGLSWRANPVFTGLAAGSYNVLVRVSGTNCDEVYFGNPVVIAQPNAPTVLTPLDELFTCSTDPYPVTLQLSEAIRTYKISGGGGYFNAAVNGTEIKFDAVPVAPTSTFLVELTGTSGCIATEEFRITSRGTPRLSTVELTHTECGEINGSFFLTIANGAPPFTFDMYKDGVLLSENEVIPGNARQFNDLGHGLYRIDLTDKNGCSSTIEVRIEYRAINYRVQATIEKPACGSQDGSIAVDYAPAEVTKYVWTDAAGTVLSQETSLQNIGAGTYHLFASRDGDCIEKYVYQVQEKTGIDVRINEIAHIDCYDNTFGAISYVIRGSGQYIVTMVGTNLRDTVPGNQNLVWEGLAGGDYEMLVTAIAGNCTSTKTFTIRNHALELAVSSNHPTDCKTHDGKICLEVEGSFTPFRIQGGGVDMQGLPSGTYCINDLKSGDYNIVVTDARGCRVEKPIQLQAQGQPQLSRDEVMVSDITCPEESANGAIRSLSATSFQIFDATGLFVSYTPATDLVAGNYLVVLEEAGCKAELPVEVKSPDQWYVDVDIVAESCETDDGSILVFVNGANGGYTFDWSAGVQATLNIATGLNSLGTYAVTVLDSKGCKYEILDLKIPYDCPDDCLPVFTVDNYHVELVPPTTDVCLPVNDINISNHTIWLDGRPYTGQTDLCETKIVFYDINSLVSRGNPPYLLESWKFGNKNLENLSFRRIEILVDTMNAVDPLGNWIYDSQMQRISGGDPARVYGEMQISHQGFRLLFRINDEIQSRTGIDIGQEGTHMVVFFSPNGRCPDTLMVNVRSRDVRPGEYYSTLETPVNTPLEDICHLAGDLDQLGLVASFCYEPVNGHAVMLGPECLDYIPGQDFIGVDSFCVEICNAVGECHKIFFTIHVVDRELIVYTGFSPNEDQVNQFLKIKNIEYYPDNKIVIFNRWGNVVYRKEGYTNELPWHGTYQDAPLPDGTYFYMLEDGKGKKYSGFIEIRK
jgi:gliding motility-associated-like protein